MKFHSVSLTHFSHIFEIDKTHQIIEKNANLQEKQKNVILRIFMVYF